MAAPKTKPKKPEVQNELVTLATAKRLAENGYPQKANFGYDDNGELTAYGAIMEMEEGQVAAPGIHELLNQTSAILISKAAIGYRLRVNKTKKLAIHKQFVEALAELWISDPKHRA